MAGSCGHSAPLTTIPRSPRAGISPSALAALASGLLAAFPQAQHRHRVVLERFRAFHERLQRAVVTAGRDAEPAADLDVLARRQLPPLTLEVDDRALVVG